MEYRLGKNSVRQKVLSIVEKQIENLSPQAPPLKKQEKDPPKKTEAHQLQEVKEPLPSPKMSLKDKLSFAMKKSSSEKNPPPHKNDHLSSKKEKEKSPSVKKEEKKSFIDTRENLDKTIQDFDKKQEEIKNLPSENPSIGEMKELLQGVLNLNLKEIDALDESEGLSFTKVEDPQQSYHHKVSPLLPYYLIPEGIQDRKNPGVVITPNFLSNLQSYEENFSFFDAVDEFLSAIEESFLVEGDEAECEEYTDDYEDLENTSSQEFFDFLQSFITDSLKDGNQDSLKSAHNLLNQRIHQYGLLDEEQVDDNLPEAASNEQILDAIFKKMHQSGMIESMSHLEPMGLFNEKDLSTSIENILGKGLKLGFQSLMENKKLPDENTLQEFVKNTLGEQLQNKKEEVEEDSTPEQELGRLAAQHQNLKSLSNSLPDSLMDVMKPSLLQMGADARIIDSIHTPLGPDLNLARSILENLHPENPLDNVNFATVLASLQQKIGNPFKESQIIKVIEGQRKYLSVLQEKSQKDSPSQYFLEDLKKMKETLQEENQATFYISFEQNALDKKEDFLFSLKKETPSKIEENIHYLTALSRIELFLENQVSLCPLKEEEVDALKSIWGKKKNSLLKF